MSLDKGHGGAHRARSSPDLEVPEEELSTAGWRAVGDFCLDQATDQKISTNNVEPLSSVSDVTLPMRDDKVTDGGVAEKVLFNAPGGAVYIDHTDRNAGGFFTVPKVVE